MEPMPAIHDVEGHNIMHRSPYAAGVEKHSVTQALRTQRVPHPRVYAITLSRARDRSCLNVLAAFQSNSFSVLHTTCCVTCDIPATTVTRVGSPLRQRYIASILLASTQAAIDLSISCYCTNSSALHPSVTYS